MDNQRTDGDYTPFWAGAARQPTSLIKRPTRAGTPAGYLVATLPLIALIIDIFFFASGSISWTEIVSIALAFDCIAYALARVDQNQLAKLRVTVPTHAGLALLAPTIYLFVRGTRAYRETGVGYGAAWVSVGVIVAIAFTLHMLPVVVAALETLSAAQTNY